MNIDEIVSIARRSKSLIERDGLAFICTIAQQAPDGLGVELGVYLGSSLIGWSLARAGRGRAVGVDNWTYRDIPNLKERCVSTINAAGATVELIDLSSVDAAMIITEPIAFLHIDADHTRAAVEKDIELWAPKVMQGGVIAFHDYGRFKDGIQVTEVVNEWQRREPWVLLGKAETSIGFIKP